MLLLKSCPKCRGDVELGSGADGDFVKCLMCGLTRYMADKPRFPVHATTDSDETVEFPKAS